MQMYYVSPLGKVNFSFRGDGLLRVTELSGISNPAEVISSSFIASTGQTVIKNRRPEARRIIVGGDILCSRRQLSAMSRILAREGWLYLIFGSKKRRIYCNISSFQTGTRYGDYIKFSLSLTCFDPYFSDFTSTDIVMHGRKDLIYPVFTLPCVFTEGVDSGFAFNSGDKEIYPTFTVHALKSGQADFTVTNLTTGKAARFIYPIEGGDTLVIDTESRRITLDGENAVTALAKGSFLGDLYLVCGGNSLGFSASDTNLDFDCRCHFFNKYCEGEY